MKRFVLLPLLVLVIESRTHAQNTEWKKSSTYESVMLTNIKSLDTASSGLSFLTLANNFARIGNAEKSKWLPYYYTSYCYVAMAFLSADNIAIDPWPTKPRLH